MSQTREATTTGPTPVLVTFPKPQSQSRVTVLFRGILAIPHFIALVVLGIAAQVVAFIGWWAALVTGELPAWAHEFLTGVTRWSTRVSAYSALLTDQYPPFSLADSDYPVQLSATRTPLNRLAVLFRLILAIPAAVLTVVASLGLGILSFFGWLITLFSGRMPAGLHEAFTALVRLHARYAGYVFMITPEYPWQDLYGDQAGPAGPAFLAAKNARKESGPWRLVLSASGRTLVTVALIVGLVGYAGDIALAASGVFSTANSGGNTTAKSGGTITANSPAQRRAAYQLLTGDYRLLGAALASYQGKIAACKQDYVCVNGLDNQLSQSFEIFSGGITGSHIPAALSAESSALSAASNNVIDDLDELAGAQSEAQFQSAEASSSLSNDLGKWEAAYSKLAADLRRP
jgi:Domain of unknown function (DUF4389)